MKYAVALGAFAAAASAQELAWELITGIPVPTTASVPVGIATVTTISYNAETAVASVVAEVEDVGTYQLITEETEALEKKDLESREACQAQTLGSGPQPSRDTTEAFLNYSVFADAANSATTPDQYALAYKNLSASSNGYSYMGYTTLKTYDTVGCAALCTKTSGCNAFNIYYERAPTVV